MVSPAGGFLELVLQLTLKCNLRCRYCYLPKEPLEIPWEIAKVVVEDARSAGVTRLNLYGGEPLLYSRIRELLRLVDRLGFDEVVITTNGTLIDRAIDVIPSNAVVQLSLDGPREVTDALRGPGVFDKVVRAARLLRGRGIAFGFAMVYNKVTRNYLLDMVRLALELGAEFLHVNFQFGDYPGAPRATVKEYIEDVGRIKKAIPPFLLRITEPRMVQGYCFAGTHSFAFTPHLVYLACPRWPSRVLGRWPELPSDIVRKLRRGYGVRAPCHGGRWELVPLDKKPVAVRPRLRP